MIGQSLAHYKILEKIGSGGMGDVYLAEDTKLGRKIALKVLPPEFAESEERRARFVREARAASAIDHPNVAQIFEIGEKDGIHFITMQFVEGENLAVRVKNGPLATADIISIGLQVADALDAAHAKRIVHRDMSSVPSFTRLLPEASIRGTPASAAVILGLSLDPSRPCLR